MLPNDAENPQSKPQRCPDDFNLLMAGWPLNYDKEESIEEKLSKANWYVNSPLASMQY